MTTSLDLHHQGKRRGMRHWDVRISGIGGHLPGEAMDNAALLARYPLDTTDEWLRTHTGVVSRHFAPDGVVTSDIATAAAELALEDAGITAGDLDRIILGSTTFDHPSPATACKVQAALGARCPAEDKEVSCSSFLYGLDHGARLVATGLDHVLVIGVDLKSRFVRDDDRRLKPIMADGGGAVILSRHDGPGGLLECELFADGRWFSNMYTPAGGTARPPSHETVDSDEHNIVMTVDGQTIAADAAELMTFWTRKVCTQAGLVPSEIDVFIPHQANKAIMDKVVARLGIAQDATVCTITHSGNIIAGTLPYGLYVARRRGLLAPGKIVCLTVAGAGYSGGAAIYVVPE